MTEYFCNECKNSDPGRFVHDKTRDDVICTTCGIVQRGMFTSTNNKNYSTPVPVVAGGGASRIERGMLTRFFPKEQKKLKCHMIISDLCSKYDICDMAMTRARVIFDKHMDDLLPIKPRINVLVACIIVACHSLKIYINISKIENYFLLSGVSKVYKTVCGIVGINTRVVILNSIPAMVCCMGLSGKYNKVLKTMFIKSSRKKSSIGAETRMALCCYKLYQDHGDKSKKITLQNIADLTNTSITSVTSYINPKGGIITGMGI